MKKLIFTAICSLTFGILQTKAQINKIYDFEFNNSLTASVGTGTFAPQGFTTYSYTTDRHGNPNGALAASSPTNTNPTTRATLSALPIGNSARTISLWFNAQTIPTANVQDIFYYGSNSTGSNQKCGVYRDGQNPSYLKLSNDNSNITTHYPSLPLNSTWNHLAISYNGTKLKAYINGNSYFSKTIALNTLAGQLFDLNLTGLIDDLKIYDGALTNAQIAGLFSVNDTISTFPTAQIVNIPDNNFKAAALTYTFGTKKINQNEDNEIQIWEADQTNYYFDFSNKNISDLTGIETFTNVNTIDVSNNQITSIDISPITYLQILYCNNNLLTNLNLSTNPRIKQLFCNNNQLIDLDLANGNNADINYGMNYFNATNNPSLTCIKVDNATYSNTNWTGSSFQKDAGASYSANCGVTTGVTVVNSAKFDFSIYPNPANDVITINYDGLNEANSSIEITNTVGQIIMKQDVANETLKNINVSNLSNGIYYVQLKQNGKSIATKKLVINK